MTGPSNTPRGEKPGTRGTTWETEPTEIGDNAERYDDDPAAYEHGPIPEARPANRATRRAAARAARRKQR
ncbi:hypothetical protein [Streptomyces tauricus]|uniref:hypothetical protein n=1 Tax=Streptomyces tauricus TaxID=68274 RepID=UPI00342EFFE1